ncbi:NYN domain-containing protein [Arthrobacter sp. I2-34]|uniref:NYN domain-containing protein n=1 Tax=Arthrobacter hankyongi TaxID=2904801 RepID=A0ABS9L7C7_9MICC|nr:NYN domain-containing protein [Arthrobacter hankyongi]MCG2622572.1 NYN domain-containing protein [Arthrobacter hankyongi]
MNSGIAVFMDFENIRRTGHQMFARDFDESEVTVSPVLLAELIASRRHQAAPISRISIVRGQPNRFRDPVAASRFERDAAAWSQDPRVKGDYLPLHYGPQRTRPKESGVDLRLGLNFVEAAKAHRYEAIVLLTGDTDLKPAIDDAAAAGTRVEVAFWSSRSHGFDSPVAEYAVRQKHLWHHRLSEEDFWHCVPERRTAA